MNDQTFEVNSIENLTSEHEEIMEIDTESDFDLESEDFNLDQIINSAVDWASMIAKIKKQPMSLRMYRVACG